MTITANKPKAADRMTFDKFDERKRTKYIECLRDGMTKGGAAKKVALSAFYIREYGKRYPQFKLIETEALEEGSERQIDKVEVSLYMKALEGNVTATIFYLMNRRPHRWRDMRGMMIRSIEDVINLLPPDIGRMLRERLATDVSAESSRVQTEGEGEA